MSKDIDPTMENEDAYLRSRSNGGDQQFDRTSLYDRPVSRLTALNATLTLHPVWMWGLKPASIGLLSLRGSRAREKVRW